MIQRVFWGWDRPVLAQAVDLLTQDWQGGELDLATTLLIVPSAESGRRLKEALAHATAARGGAVSAPHVWVPEQALLMLESGGARASHAQCLLAWTRVMQDADLADLPHLFPVSPTNQGWTWATEMARALYDVSTTLGAGGYRFADVARLAEPPPDHGRWEELARLEKDYDDALARLNVTDPQLLKRQQAESHGLPEAIKRVIVLPAPDLPVLFRRWLEGVSEQHVETTIYIQAPAALAEQFDRFGAPLPAAWGEQSRRVLPLAEPQIHLEHDPAGQARKVLELARGLLPVQPLALGVCDPETTAHLEDQLKQEGVDLYLPSGVPAARHGTVQMLALWAGLVASDDWKAFASLLRLPEVRDTLAQCEKDGMNLIAEADAFATERLPVTLAHAQELLPSYLKARQDLEKNTKAIEQLQTAIAAARRLAGTFGQQPLHEAARSLLVELFGERLYRTDLPQQRDHVALCTSWLEFCQELQQETDDLGIQSDAASLLGLSLDWLREQNLSDPRGNIDLVLLGWLELLWEPAPALVVSGFNEERVPGILISHPFLPDQLRQRLGLACQASRFARDAYLLTALAGQRQAGGSLHLTCGLWSERKDTLRPSRLLFLCEDQALPTRVRHLFPKDFESTLPRELPRQRAWKLLPQRPAAEPLPRVSASRLSAYLRCPFTYYLDYVLGMSGLEPDKRELDAMEYGTLLHGALACLQGQKATDEGSLAGLLVEAVEDGATRLYGRRLPVPVEVQLDTARQRLRAAAAIESDERTAGWLTLKTEQPLGDETDPHPLVIEGARFTGRIDRIDHHPQRGTRIIDYKTGDKPLPPMQAHLKPLTKRSQTAPEDEWKIFTDSEGDRHLWQDLQLPLYVKAWSLHEPGPVQAAYWILPKAMEEAKLQVFEELDEQLMQSALSVAAEAVRRINAGIFWPPAKGARFDSYTGLIQGAAADAIDPEFLLGGGSAS